VRFDQRIDHEDDQAARCRPADRDNRVLHLNDELRHHVVVADGAISRHDAVFHDALRVSFGLACNAARVAPVALARRGLMNVAKDRQRGLRKERIEMRGS
jgi:hypothetical protein